MKSATLRGLRQLLWPKNASSSDGPQKLRPTAYLDGLRGFAAFLVYIHHHQLWAHGMKKSEIFENAFGYKGEFHLATFHFLRNFFTGGHVAVAVFYVISGYVLSVKPLSLIHAGEHLKLFDNLASAFFRRWFRLYIPLMVTTLVYVTSWHVFGIWNAACEPKGTIGEEIWNWYVEFKNFSFLFKEGWMWVNYNTHLWSIPLEMKGSIITFTACIALARATSKARLICLLALVIYFLYIVDGYYCALFVAGMLQCDLDLLARKDGYFPRFLRRLEPYKTFIFYHFFFIGLWLAGVPSQNNKVEQLRENPGWYWLSYLKPQAVFDYKWFYLFIAGNMLVACIPRIAWLKRFFESRFCQFLGRISFALYLVHGPILNTIGDRVYYAVGWVRAPDDKHAQIAHWANLFPLPKTGPMGLEIAFLVPNIFLLPLTLYVADIVTRAVDDPAVKFAAWLYKRIQGGEATDAKPIELAPLMRVD
ncbi:acyltransferase 3 [Chaetomium strumarium]|uniref:Acyltransferase 3 n=1 Tax=Chaetomium strumarium TaxID=1170767 RepID=A0AAJ0GWC3_9PEZI|nr:acyltransferase 3 [Chaetomium strumarium]